MLYALREVPEDTHAEPMALLRVELHAENMVALEGGVEIAYVVRREQDVEALRAPYEIGMDEVEAQFFGHAGKQRALLHGAHDVPSHVRNLLSPAGGVESHDAGVDPAQTGL